jgi:hypothetical protein
LTKRRVGDADKTLKAEEARRKLNLRYEMMNMKTLCNEEGECLEEQALISGKFMGKYRNCGQVGHSHFSARTIQTTMVEITVTELEKIIAHTVASRSMTRRVASSSSRRKLKTAMLVI